MLLQPLFHGIILEQRPLDPGYSGHASDVWLVRTEAECVVVRASRMAGEPSNVFWWGCRDLFGIDPRRVLDLEPLNAQLHNLSPIPVPRVIRTGRIENRPCVVVEFMPGKPLKSFLGLPDSMLEGLGQALAHIHRHRFDHCGHPVGALKYPTPEFHARMVETMRSLVARFYQGHTAIEQALDSMCMAANSLPAPDGGALIMVDMDPTQFLTADQRLTALVDTEAYGIGPRELDFVALEYVLDERGARAFSRGYTAVMPLPTLSALRPVYRYLYRLLEIQGAVDLPTWLAHPILFA